MNKKGMQFAVFGLGRFGQSVAKNLAENGYDVLAVDSDEDAVQEASEYVMHAVRADVTDREALRSLGIRNFDVAVIAIGAEHMQSSIMAALLAKELGVKYVLAKAQDEMQKKILEKIGVDRVVFPEREMGVRIATNLMTDNIIDFLEVSSEYSIVEIEVLDEWIGKSLKDLDIRVKYGFTVMAIKRDGILDITPQPSTSLEQNDILVVIGANDDIRMLHTKR